MKTRDTRDTLPGAAQPRAGSGVGVSQLLLAILVALAACGESRRVRTQIDHPRDADELVVRIGLEGGFVPERYRYTSVPFFSLFGDGRIITVGPQIEIYPGPALPSLLVTRITEEGIQKILSEARKAGLMEGDRRYDNPRVADASTTVFTVVADGSRNVVEAYALGLDGEDEQLAELVGFQERIGNLADLIGSSEIIEEEASYEPERVQVITISAVASEPSDVQPQRLAWPLATPISAFGQPISEVMSEEGARCAASDQVSLIEALSNATEITIWESEGRDYTIWARPLLPDEAGCTWSRDTPTPDPARG